MKTTVPFEVSVVIPTYNEEKHILGCIRSLFSQTYPIKEIIIVDDGSTDDTIQVLKKQNFNNVKILEKKHSGPGDSRNLGVKRSTSPILVFVDADMMFDKNFIYNLTLPIRKNGAIGTFTTEEFLANSDNFWAKNWNLGRFAAAKNFSKEYLTSMIPDSANGGGIYRAVLKKYFVDVSGFESGGGYSDDESLKKRLGIKAVRADQAILYHYNPSSWKEVWSRAFWVGSDTKFSRDFRTRTINLIKFSLPVSLIKSVIIGAKFKELSFIPFKLFYDSAIWVAIIKK